MDNYSLCFAPGKVAAEGIAATGTYDVVNYLDSWGPANSHWLVKIDELMARNGISMDRYPAAFARSAQNEGETLDFPLRAYPQLLFYRKDLIPNPPSSWEEIIEVGKSLKESNPDVARLLFTSSTTETAKTCSFG